jgi:hypothetical protein
MSAPKIEFRTRRATQGERAHRIMMGRPDPVLRHVASIYPDDGSNHHGEGDTQAQALLRAAARWDAWEGAK